MIKRMSAAILSAAMALTMIGACPVAAKKVVRPQAVTETTFRYRGVHFGKHPVTTYEVVSEMRTAPGTSRSEVTESVRTHDGDTIKPMVWLINVERDPQGRPISEKMALPLMGAGYEFNIANGVLRGNVVSEGRRVELPELKLEEGDPVLGGVFSLNSAFRSLALPVGGTVKVRIIDVDDANTAFVVRPFTIHVLGKQTFQLEGKPIAALNLRLFPSEANPLYGGTFLVTEASPHVALRSEIVADYDRKTNEVVSTGTEALVGITGGSTHRPT